ncbi:MAG: ABC transporter ATP-binding protein [Deltaproteobacteria bacterium]|nr:MAG: ABC transporter ATP-binding protein [Deltaproteobacteria bacterium]
MASIRLEQLRKAYPDGTVAVRELDLEIADGELLVLVGPSGCGKSTVLRLVAGLETPSRGRVFLGEADVTRRPPQERDLAMVFQSYALYPHMSVAENLGFGLRMRGVARPERTRRVAEVAALLGLEALLERRPAQLSGGQRQRVALGRAIAREPQAFLLDEPLSNLDARLRTETRTELARLRRRLRATMLYVTHDQEEAMTLGDRIAVMRDGRVQQIARPLEVYGRPSNAFVAQLVGSPAMNLIPCRLVQSGASPRLEGAGLRIDVAVASGARAGAPTSELWLGVRPHDVDLVASGSGDAEGRIDVVEAFGSGHLMHVELPDEGGARVLRVEVAADRPIEVNERVAVRLRRDRLHVFDAATGERVEGIRATPGSV